MSGSASTVWVLPLTSSLNFWFMAASPPEEKCRFLGCSIGVSALGSSSSGGAWARHYARARAMGTGEIHSLRMMRQAGATVALAGCLVQSPAAARKIRGPRAPDCGKDDNCAARHGNLD